MVDLGDMHEIEYITIYNQQNRRVNYDEELDRERGKLQKYSYCHIVCISIYCDVPMKQSNQFLWVFCMCEWYANSGQLMVIGKQTHTNANHPLLP